MTTHNDERGNRQAEGLTQLDLSVAAEACEFYAKWIQRRAAEHIIQSGVPKESVLIVAAMNLRRAASSSVRGESGSAVEIGWLIENGKNAGDGLLYRTMKQGNITWTADVNAAIRFARRADAELFAEEDEDAWRIVEHGWYPRLSEAFPPPPAAPSDESGAKVTDSMVVAAADAYPGSVAYRDMRKALEAALAQQQRSDKGGVL